MTKCFKRHHKELKNTVTWVPLKVKNIAQETKGAMLKNLEKRCKKYVVPIRVKVVLRQRLDKEAVLFVAQTMVF